MQLLQYGAMLKSQTIYLQICASDSNPDKTPTQQNEKHRINDFLTIHIQQDHKQSYNSRTNHS